MQKHIIKAITKDYKNGCSLRKLRDKYGYEINTLHYNLKKKNVLRTIKIVRSVRNNSLLIGLFIGLWAGDGSKFREKWMYTVKIHLNKNDKELIKLIKKLMLRLFDINVNLSTEKNNNKGTIRFRSRFIYDFIDLYLSYKEYKTLTVRLKNVNKYPKNFLRGFLLGATLSDGYIKKRFVYTSISKNLIRDIDLILKKFNYNAAVYKQDNHRKHRLYNLVLNPSQTVNFKDFLNKVIRECNSNKSIEQLKGYNQ
ncbi:MAG TPA: LAGLIDADG family homing endonuclease [Candidatus Nanoarchaeia archaeon]|nr:LAGLIDADG family homing endonuclease [Candidatus Nanoarchaeia archaeon]